ncbi:MAG: 6-phosphogluconolactonase [Elusimicrobiales bacterium]|nr:6-phosphogluconolactonase [Elusimicrobiales bacterium]
MSKGPEVRVFASPAGMAAFLRRFLAAETARLEPGEFFDLALSGGRTPEAVLAAMARPGGPDWRRVRFFWGDERMVPPSSELSNYRMARRALLAPAGVPQRNIFRIRGEAPPVAEARRYSGLVKKLLPSAYGVPRFGLVLLGLGEDGHTASIFPGNAGLFRSKEIFASVAGPAGGPNRITAAGGIINSARAVFFLVSGGAKADAAARVLRGGSGARGLPAALVRPRDGRLTWLLDKAAAARLPRRRP